MTSNDVFLYPILIGDCIEGKKRRDPMTPSLDDDYSGFVLCLLLSSSQRLAATEHECHKAYDGSGHANIVRRDGI